MDCTCQGVKRELLEQQGKQLPAKMKKKPSISRQQAAEIAIQFASAHGITATGTPGVSDPQNEGKWTVSVPDDGRFEPGFTLIVVDQETGEASFFLTL
jgi:hypothetical protein